MSGFGSGKDELDRVLRGLGSVEAPAGMEMRVLAAVRGAEARKASATGGVWGWRFALGGVALAAMVLVAFGVHGFGLRQGGGGGGGVGASVKEARGGLVTAVVAAQVRGATEVPQTMERRVGRPAVIQEAEKRETPLVREVSAAMVHVNLPAPEAPLTEQERLLYRLADQVTRPERVALEAGAGTQSEAAERQQFNEFFPARTEIEQPVQLAQDLQPSLEHRRK